MYFIVSSWMQLGGGGGVHRKRWDMASSRGSRQIECAVEFVRKDLTVVPMNFFRRERCWSVFVSNGVVCTGAVVGIVFCVLPAIGWVVLGVVLAIGLGTGVLISVGYYGVWVFLRSDPMCFD